MPLYTYVCQECGKQEDVLLSISKMTEEINLLCQCNDSVPPGTLHKHKISTPAIGQVDGAGNSPARGSL